jgi:hypothetical protein
VTSQLVFHFDSDFHRFAWMTQLAGVALRGFHPSLMATMEVSTLEIYDIFPPANLCKSSSMLKSRAELERRKLSYRGKTSWLLLASPRNNEK